MNLKCDFLVSSLCSFKFNLYRYTLEKLLASGKVTAVFANEDEARELAGGGTVGLYKLNQVDR